MTGYELTAKMRKIRRRYPLTSTEQALFYELVAICNEDEWAESFFVASRELCHALGITENTLNNARLRLIQVGLISYNSGKSKRQFSEYSFIVTVSKNDTDVGTDKSTDVGTDKSTVSEKKLMTIINNKTKQNKTKNSKSHSENEFSVIEEIEKLEIEKSKPPENSFFKIFTKIWFDFYSEKIGTKPIFNSVDGSKLKSIEKKLKIKAQEFQNEWTSELATDSFKQFLEISFKDKWRSENFSLSVIDSQFNQITAKALKNDNSNNKIEEFFANWK
jgi:hypothetical protein